MSLHVSSRRAMRSITSLSTSLTLRNYLFPCTQRRTIFGWGRRKEIDTTPTPKNTLTEEYLKAKPKGSGLVRGDLSSSSIFEDEELAGPKPKAATKVADGLQSTARNPQTMAAALDPDPRGRRRWERKMVIRDVHKRGRYTRAQMLKKQERELLSKSHDFKTSVKKLVPLAQQIAGKTLDDAIIQMRFSKKKAAKDVREHLEHARNEAIVKRGMGIGAVDGQKMAPIHIQTKNKKRVKVVDPTTIYVDQAWVGRGLYTLEPDYRARGAMFMMKNPTTSLSVILKEEKTRLRLDTERLEKIKNRKLWVQLPNRPITAQRQHYSW